MKLNHALVLISALIVTPLLRAGDLPAPLPEFMDQQQLAKWNANQSAVQTMSSPAEPSTQFYTGKPYVADAGGYVYKYRTYNPEMSRWTSADPSGFPDGVNNNIYACVPTTEVDRLGLTSGAYWIGDESTYSPNATQEQNAAATFSWSITNPSGQVVLSGSVTGTFSQIYNESATVGFVTWEGVPLGNSTFGQSETIALASNNGSGQWSLNGWTVTAGFLENAGATAAELAAVNARINPYPTNASTSATTLLGLSSLLYTTLLNDGAGYNGDLYYE